MKSQEESPALDRLTLLEEISGAAQVYRGAAIARFESFSGQKIEEWIFQHVTSVNFDRAPVALHAFASRG
jgi:hypothetical protein